MTTSATVSPRSRIPTVFFPQSKLQIITGSPGESNAIHPLLEGGPKTAGDISFRGNPNTEHSQTSLRIYKRLLQSVQTFFSCPRKTATPTQRIIPIIKTTNWIFLATGSRSRKFQVLKNVPTPSKTRIVSQTLAK